MDVSKLRALSLFATIGAMAREAAKMSKGGSFTRPGDFYSHGSQTFKKNQRKENKLNRKRRAA